MDFAYTPEQDDAGKLAATILGEQCTPERLKAIDGEAERFDRDLWQRLGDAGLLGLAVPEAYAGAGLSLLELCTVLVETGRVVAPVPLVAHGPTALAIAEFGSDDQKAEWLVRSVDGQSVLTSAIAEDLDWAPVRPRTHADRTDQGWLLTGLKTLVTAGTVADLFLVPAETDEGVTVFLVRPDDAGVSVAAQELSDGDIAGRLELDGVSLGPERVLGPARQGADVACWLGQRLTVALCAEQVGRLDGALALTGEYARTRHQFGRAIGTFQAVSQRLADAYIDVLGARLTLWQAAWRLSEGLPSVAELATAKLWAAEAGHRVAHTTVHVHGGVGIDLDGEAHRFFTGIKRLELTLGGGTEQARTIGRVLAESPV